MHQTQKDNGKRDQKFIGIGHVTEPGTAGYVEALKSGAADTVGFDKVLKIKIVNHLSTDGESKNTGHLNGLWKLLDDEREKLDVSFPLLKSVCFFHLQMHLKICVRLFQKLIIW